MSPTPGYDPAWSPDGTRIAYVAVGYKRDPELGLLLDNDLGEPTARDEIRLWELGSGVSRLLELTNLRRGHGFVSCLTWVDDSRVAFFLSSVDRVVQGKDTMNTLYDWDVLVRYRMLPSAPVVADHDAGRGDPMMRLSRRSQMERLSDSRTAVWTQRGSKADGTRLPASVAVVAPDGAVESERQLPEREWRSSVGAFGTLRTGSPIMVRYTDAAEYRLSRVETGTVEDFYASAERITSVFGSPDGQYVAFLQEDRNLVGHCSLMVLDLQSGQSKRVGDGAYGESRITWSPDGRHIAYVRESDGHIVVADVAAEVP